MLAISTRDFQKTKEIQWWRLKRLISFCVIPFSLASSIGSVEPASETKDLAQPWKIHVVDSSGTGADGVRLKDANRDGHPDLISGWEQSGWSILYLSQNNGGPSPRWTRLEVGKAEDVEDALLADIDGDGWMDVVSSTEGQSRKVIVHWGPDNDVDYYNSAKWNSETLYDDGSRWMYAINWDVNKDGRTDLVLGGKNKGSTTGWLEAPPQGRQIAAWKYHPISPTGWTMSLLEADIDRDGDPDLLLGDRRGALSGVRWLENPGPNSPLLRAPWKSHMIGAAGWEVQFISYADLDGDGIKEVIAPYYKGNDNKLSLFQLALNGNWVEHPIAYPEMLGRPKSAVIGDINLDGLPDIVLSAEQAYGDLQGIVWLQNTGSPFLGSWKTRPLSGSKGIKFDLNILQDLDRDGDLDVLNTEEQFPIVNGNLGLGVIWYENPRIQK